MIAPGQTALTVAFLGTPEFAATVLRALAVSRHRIVRVITQPDRPRGRGMRCIPTAVGQLAQTLDLPLTKLRPGAHTRLAALFETDRPDVIVTAAWAGLVRSAARSQARLAAINVHASLLPRWRGAAPIERAIMAGDDLTGITVIYMSDELDAGDILLAGAQSIPADRDAGWLREQLAGLGAGLLIEALDHLARGSAARIPQPAEGVTIARKLTAEDERIDWQQPARTIHNWIRAMAPKPGAYFEDQGGRVIVTRAEAVDCMVPAPGPAASVLAAGEAPVVPGTVIERSGQSLLIAAGQGTAIRLLLVKPAGSREMPAGAFANGRRVFPGQILEKGRAQVVPLG